MIKLFFNSKPLKGMFQILNIFWTEISKSLGSMGKQVIRSSSVILTEIREINHGK